MTVYFNRIEQLSRNEEALDSRHRFMLVDLIEQRRNRWRPRKEVRGSGQRWLASDPWAVALVGAGTD